MNLRHSQRYILLSALVLITGVFIWPPKIHSPMSYNVHSSIDWNHHYSLETLFVLLAIVAGGTVMAWKRERQNNLEAETKASNWEWIKGEKSWEEIEAIRLAKEAEDKDSKSPFFRTGLRSTQRFIVIAGLTAAIWVACYPQRMPEAWPIPQPPHAVPFPQFVDLARMVVKWGFIASATGFLLLVEDVVLRWSKGAGRMGQRFIILVALGVTLHILSFPPQLQSTLRGPVMQETPPLVYYINLPWMLTRLGLTVSVACLLLFLEDWVASARAAKKQICGGS